MIQHVMHRHAQAGKWICSCFMYIAQMSHAAMLGAGDPSAKRSLLPAFDAAAAQAGKPLFELQPFEPLLLDDEGAGLQDTPYAGQM